MGGVRQRARSPNGAGTLYREAGRGWVSEAYVDLPDGRRKRVRGRGRTVDEAVVARARAADRLLRESPDYDRLTVTELSEQWVGAREGDWKPSTVASYRAALDLHVLPVLGGARVRLVRSLDAQRVIASVRAKAPGANVALANRVRRVMHALFNQAKRWGVIEHNPIAGLEPVRARAREPRAWTEAEAFAFLRAAARSPYRELFEAAVFTGLRQGELIALRWRDAEFGMLVVRRTYSQHAPGRVSAPKSGRSRRVPLPPELWRALEARRGRPDELVYGSRRGTMLNPVNVRRALIAYAQRAGVPVLRFHDLRRTYATLMAQQGSPPALVQARLGHATPDLALRVYTVVNERLYEERVPAVGGYFGGSPHDPARPHAASGEQDGTVVVVPEALN